MSLKPAICPSPPGAINGSGRSALPWRADTRQRATTNCRRLRFFASHRRRPASGHLVWRLPLGPSRPAASCRRRSAGRLSRVASRPHTSWPPRSESLQVVRAVEGLALAIDPAVAERRLKGFLVGDGGYTGAFLAILSQIPSGSGVILRQATLPTGRLRQKAGSAARWLGATGPVRLFVRPVVGGPLGVHLGLYLRRSSRR